MQPTVNKRIGPREWLGHFSSQYFVCRASNCKRKTNRTPRVILYSGGLWPHFWSKVSEQILNIFLLSSSGANTSIYTLSCVFELMTHKSSFISNHNTHFACLIKRSKTYFFIFLFRNVYCVVCLFLLSKRAVAMNVHSENCNYTL